MYIILVCVGILIGHIYTDNSDINRGYYIENYKDNVVIRLN